MADIEVDAFGGYNVIDETADVTFSLIPTGEILMIIM